MRHLHEERLAGLALGEPDPLALAPRVHLVWCRHCAGRLADLRKIVSTGRAGQPYPLREPRPGTLAAIQAELAGDRSPVTSVEPPAQPSAVARPVAASRRGPRYVPRLVAAAAVLAVAVGGTVWYRVAAEDIVARATLTPLPEKSGEGQARLVRKDGAQELAIDVKGAAPVGVFEELWLINADGRRMISLGVVPPDGRASYPVPAALKGKGYTIVDISLEPYDGNVKHSHNSVLRGTLS